MTNKIITSIEVLGTEYDIKSIPYHKTAEDWEASNYIPQVAEIVIYDTDSNNDTPRFKMGDGSKKVKELPFVDTKIANLITDKLNHTFVFNEGTANGNYSIAGGTKESDGLSNIVGFNLGELPASEANGIMSISYGTSNIAHSSASNAVGIKNQAGFRGYYIHEKKDSKTLKLSTSQTNYSQPNEEILKEWQGCQVTIINKDLFPLCGKVQNVNGDTIVFEQDLPFEELNSSTDKPHDRSIFVIPPVETVGTIKTYRPEALGEVELGFSATAFGFDNIAAGTLSTAAGYRNTAIGTAAFVTGRENTGAFASLVGGYNNIATGSAAFASGQSNKATGKMAHVEGTQNEAAGDFSHAEGSYTKATGVRGHAEGWGTMATANTQHVQGKYNYLDKAGSAGNYAHIVGNGDSDDKRSNAHTLDWSGNAWFAGDVTATKANGESVSLLEVASAVETANVVVGQTTEQGGEIFNDYDNNAANSYSHAEGRYTQAMGKYAHAEGGGVSAADGSITYTVAEKDYSHAEGCKTKASGLHSHAEGRSTTASGQTSHAEGHMTQATQNYSHAEGFYTIASGYQSHAEGRYTEAAGEDQHVQGRYNIKDIENKYAHIVGNGTPPEKDENGNTTTPAVYSNAHTLDWTGNAWYKGDIKIGGTNFNDKTAVLVATKNDITELTNKINALPITEGAVLYDQEQTLNDDEKTLARSNIDALGKNEYVTVGQISGNPGFYATAEGYENQATGTYSHAEGWFNTAGGQSSHVEGQSTVAAADFSHAEGHYCTTGMIAKAAHAEGKYTQATGEASHAEGAPSYAQDKSTIIQKVIAEGLGSHAEGEGTKARTAGSHAEGRLTECKQYVR